MPPNSLIDLLRCVECGGNVDLAGGWLSCSRCTKRYPLVGGTARMLGVVDQTANGSEAAVRQRTADSFAYEWSHFGAQRPEWRKNFLDYMQPHSADSFAGRLLLDVGAGSGRHSAEAAALGARVVAVDLGDSIDVARGNLPDHALTVQADAERLPFARGTFDFVMSIGVLHHLSDPERALRSLARYAAPGGFVHVYLYWQPEYAWHQAVLKLVRAARRVTVRLPHPLLHALCYPLAGFLWAAVVLPYRSLRARPRVGRLAAGLPLKTYADYPFDVLLNDQFDRFSAPLERRYTRQQVRAMLIRTGLEEISVLPNHGWIGDGRIPEGGLQAAHASPSEGISVIIPVLNDRSGLETALAALASQTRPPNEVVVVDGGSTDGTREPAQRLDETSFPVRLVTVGDSNIAHARNRGIEAAEGPWIACTDADCRPVPGWLDAIAAAGADGDFVAGVVVIEGETNLQRALRHTHYPAGDGGSMAFRKSVWSTVGGFPQNLQASENRGFSAAVANAGFRIVRVPEAAVAWEPPASWIGNAAMFQRYARGDVRVSGRGRHLLLLAAWTVGTAGAVRGDRAARAMVAAGAIAYVALPLRRARRDGMPVREWWRIPLLVALKDLAQLAGAAYGLADIARQRSAVSRRDAGS